MPDAVTLVIEGGEGEPAQLVAQAALGDAAPADRKWNHCGLEDVGT